MFNIYGKHLKWLSFFTHFVIISYVQSENNKIHNEDSSNVAVNVFGYAIKFAENLYPSGEFESKEKKGNSTLKTLNTQATSPSESSYEVDQESFPPPSKVTKKTNKKISPNSFFKLNILTTQATSTSESSYEVDQESFVYPSNALSTEAMKSKSSYEVDHKSFVSPLNTLIAQATLTSQPLHDESFVSPLNTLTTQATSASESLYDESFVSPSNTLIIQATSTSDESFVSYLNTLTTQASKISQTFNEKISPNSFSKFDHDSSDEELNSTGCHGSFLTLKGCQVELFHRGKTRDEFFGSQLLKNELLDLLCPCPIPRLDPECDWSLVRRVRLIQHQCYMHLYM